MPTLIHASVSPKILAKIDRRFTNRIDDLFIELFQNARRAGATQITVTTREVEPTFPGLIRTEITVEDNGSGIEDFSTLLCLGDSNWNGSVAEREDAAGEGFFSLVHSGVEVTSLKQRATFTKDSFLGHFPVQVQDTDASFPGTRLVFGRSEDLKAIKEAARRIALYGHTPCSLNGSVMPQEDFLKNALSIKDVNGVRIGVYTTNDTIGWNFHGRRLHSSIPSLDSVVVDKQGTTDSLYARFDVLETQAIWLKLPDRSSVVEDDKFHALMDEAKRAMYEYLATLPSHCASFSLYSEGLKLGVHLKEASPWFVPFAAPTREFNLSSDVLPVDTKLHLVDLSTSAIADCMADEDREDFYAFTFAVAAEYFTKLAIQPIQDDGWRYKGYSWYQNVRRLHSFGLLIDGFEAKDVGTIDDLSLVDTIKLSCSLTGQESPLTWDVPFACWDNEDNSDNVKMFITKTSAWASRKDEPFDLVEAAMHVAFSFDESSNQDSFDTQEESLRDYFQREFLTVLGGRAAVIQAELTKALQGWPLSSLLKDEGIQHIQLTPNPDGYGWDVALTKAA